MSGKPRDEQWLETITHEDTVVCVLGEHESQSGGCQQGIPDFAGRAAGVI